MIFTNMIARCQKIREKIRSEAKKEGVAQARIFLRKVHNKLCNMSVLYTTLANMRAEYIKNANSVEIQKNIRKAYEMMQKGDLQEAIDVMLPYEKKYPKDISVTRMFSFCHFLSGDMDKTVYWGKVNPEKHCNLWRNTKCIKIAGDFITPSIGHTALLDTYYKLQQLQFINNWDIRIDADGHFANKSLVDKMSHFFPYYYAIERTFKKEYIESNNINLFPLKLNDGKYYNIYDAFIIAQEEWDKQGLKPVLSFTESEIAQAESQLHTLGKPEGAWFVTLHVRYTPGDMRDISNADINTYLPAIQMITDRGGYVLRIGDTRAPALPAMERVIDLAHVAEKDHFLQMYACGACMFFVGGESGPLVVPWCFGKPSIFTNMTLYLQNWNADTLTIPKIILNKETNKPVSIQEMQKDPATNASNMAYLQKKGYLCRYNTAEDICDAVAEMFDRIEGNRISDPEYALLQAKWAQTPMRLVQGNVLPSRAKVSWAFAKKYSFILD